MGIQFLEDLMYQMLDFFLAPVLVLLVILFAYSLYALGGFGCQAYQRRSGKSNYQSALNNPDNDPDITQLQGYPLISLFISVFKNNFKENKSNKTSPLSLSKEQLDIAALKELEGVRTVSRLAPMLGLIATMVPMGPALKSLADGNVQGISENLIVAFSAVIFGLVIASITFWIASVKKRWLATELVAIIPLLEKLPDTTPNRAETNLLESEREAA